MRTRAVLVGLVLISVGILDAQTLGIRQLAPISIVTGNVRVTADAGTVNESTGEIQMTGAVTVTPVMRPAVVVPAVNAAGAPFPEARSVLMRVRGDFSVSIDNMTLHAAEADINGQTGEMLLRGNVRIVRTR